MQEYNEEPLDNRVQFELMDGVPQRSYLNDMLTVANEPTWSILMKGTRR